MRPQHVSFIVTVQVQHGNRAVCHCLPWYCVVVITEGIQKWCIATLVHREHFNCRISDLPDPEDIRPADELSTPRPCVTTGGRHIKAIGWRVQMFFAPAFAIR